MMNDVRKQKQSGYKHMKITVEIDDNLTEEEITIHMKLREWSFQLKAAFMTAVFIFLSPLMRTIRYFTPLTAVSQRLRAAVIPSP